MTKRKKIRDPYAAREAEKYTNPIPSREFITQYLEKLGLPATHDELLVAFDLHSEDQQEALRRRLRAMERDGQLMSNRRGGYGLIDKMNFVRGRILGHKDGYGFLIPDDAGDDIFLSAYQMRGVFHGDRVLVRVAGIDNKGRREGSIAEILESNTQHLVGRFLTEAGIAFVAPENKRVTQDIIIPEGAQGPAQSGQMVMVEIVAQPSRQHRAVGRITEVLGDHLSPGMEIDVAIRAHELPHEWAPEVLEAVHLLDEKILLNHSSSPLKKGGKKEIVEERLDLRHLPFVTIDGEDAQDFDDAVYCEARPSGGWTLYVAIADVGHYVAPQSALDQAALERGNSVYFPGKVIPMLPEVLSNGLCSLKPNVDRLCMVCTMTIGASGRLTRHYFHPAIMHSKARLTYTEVSNLLEKKEMTLAKRHPDLVPHLKNLYKLYKLLAIYRKERGSIDFETIETRIIFGKNRKIELIIPVQRNEAHKLIEECMLLANVATATFLLKHEIPCLFRVHEGPKPEKIIDLRDFLSEFGLGLRGGKRPQASDYAQLLQQVKGRKDAQLIQTVLLRSLKQAIYTPENNGHFGLAFKAYTHFTSPIRRYPDLVVHRAIRHVLNHKKAAKFSYDKPALQTLGEHCSMTERRADEAVRDATLGLKCEFMMDRVGQEFQGLITGVTAFGLFVELQDIYIEGLIHVTALKNDYYKFDPIRHRLNGERTGKSYRLGDPLKVKVVRVSLEEKKIDLELIASSHSKSKIKPVKKITKKMPKKAKKRKRA